MGEPTAVDPGPSLPERLTAARERKGVDLVPRRARHQDPGPLPRAPSSVATTASCPAPSTRRASCATTRSISGSTPTRCCCSGGASAARRPRASPRRSSRPRPLATPRAGLTFSPSLVVFAAAAHRGRARFLRATSACSSCGSPSRRRSPSRHRRRPSPTSTRPRPPTRLAAPPPPGATVSIATPGQASRTGHRRRRRGVERSGRPPPRPQPVRRQRGRPRYRQARGGVGPIVHHRAVPRDRGADPHASTSRPTARRTRTARSRSRVRPRTRQGRGQRQRTPGPPSPSRAAPRRPAPPTPRRRRPWRSTRTVFSSRRSSSPPAKWAITVTASEPEGKTTSLTRNVTVALQGRQSRRHHQGRPGLDQGLGRRQARRRRPASPARSSAAARRSRSRARTSIEVRTGSSGVTYFTLNGTALGRSASGVPETWLFAPPDDTGQDASAADERAADRRRARRARRATRRCACLGRGSDRRARPSRAPAGSSPTPHRGPGLVRRISWAAGHLLRTRSRTRSLGVPEATLDAHGAVSAPRSRWRWPTGARAGSSADLARRDHGHRGARRRDRRRSPSGSPMWRSPTARHGRPPLHRSGTATGAAQPRRGVPRGRRCELARSSAPRTADPELVTRTAARSRRRPRARPRRPADPSRPAHPRRRDRRAGASAAALHAPRRRRGRDRLRPRRAVAVHARAGRRGHPDRVGPRRRPTSTAAAARSPGGHQGPHRGRAGPSRAGCSGAAGIALEPWQQVVADAATGARSSRSPARTASARPPAGCVPSWSRPGTTPRRSSGRCCRPR